MRTRGLVLPVVAALIAAGASVARAEDTFVPRDYSTIGEALAYAKAGDRIVVVGGRHLDILMDKDGVAVVGRGATLDGDTRIAGAGVSVSGFRFANWGRVTITGDDAVFARNSVGRHTTVVVNGGDRALIERNSLTPTGVRIEDGAGVVVRANRLPANSGIESRGEATLIEGNRVWWIRTTGPGAVIRSNRVAFLSSEGDGATCERNFIGRALDASGRGVSVVSNRARGGIAVLGDDARVTGNEVTRAANGILVTGSRARVVSNSVVSGSPLRHAAAGVVAPWSGIEVDATESGGAVADNDVTHLGTYGIVVHADGMTVSGNALHGLSSLTSLVIVGDGNVVSGNDLTQTPDSGGSGIDVAGDANALSDNQITGVALDAVVLAGTGNTVTRSVIESAGACGILVPEDAPGTVIADCTVSDCPIGVANEAFDTEMTGTTISGSSLADVLDLGGFAVFENNVYVTLSHDTLLAPHR